MKSLVIVFFLLMSTSLFSAVTISDEDVSTVGERSHSMSGGEICASEANKGSDVFIGEGSAEGIKAVSN